MIYDLLVIGATFAGLGAALSCDGDTIVTERRPDVGYEWLRTFERSAPWICDTSISVQGQKLCDVLKKAQILDENKIVKLAEIAPYVYRMLYRSNQTYLFMTELMCVRRTEKSYAVTVHNAGGTEVIYAKKIIDATFGSSLPYADRPKPDSKTLNAIIWGRGDFPMLKGAEALPLERNGEALVRFEVDPDCGYAKARHDLMEFWQNNRDNTDGWTIAAVSECFSMKFKELSKEVAADYRLISPFGYSSPLEAFEAGVKMTAEGGKG